MSIYVQWKWTYNIEMGKPEGIFFHFLHYDWEVLSIWIDIFNGNGSNIIWNCRPNSHFSLDETWLLFGARQNLRVQDNAALCKFSISGPAKHQVPTVPLPVILHYIDDRQN